MNVFTAKTNRGKQMEEIRSWGGKGIISSMKLAATPWLAIRLGPTAEDPWHETAHQNLYRRALRPVMSPAQMALSLG